MRLSARSKVVHLDFFVPGFSKCGTTTLCALLAEHPDIFIPEAKETNFFADAFDHGWEWYEKFFENARAGQTIGEGSTFYSSGEFAEMACTRILQYFPNARFIFIARNPVRRIESSYREFHHSGAIYGVNAPFSIGEALRSLPNMIEDTLYWTRLSTFRKHVPDSRLLTLLLENLERQPAVELARCFEFLGVTPSARIASTHRRLNPGDAKLYDSRLMRFMRVHPRRSRRWEQLPNRWTARLEKWLRLRRPFTGPIEWDAETLEWFLHRVGDEARQFLTYCGAPPDFWGDMGARRPASPG
jgi:hypothetical protein